MAAKEQWVMGRVANSRSILEAAFQENPNSEEIWLAAAKLEWESNEIERARAVLQRARIRAPSARVYMKSALLERECDDRAAEQVRLFCERTLRFFNGLHRVRLCFGACVARTC
jgi:pre-mRNA-processing factor 6